MLSVLILSDEQTNSSSSSCCSIGRCYVVCSVLMTSIVFGLKAGRHELVVWCLGWVGKSNFLTVPAGRGRGMFVVAPGVGMVESM